MAYAYVVEAIGLGEVLAPSLVELGVIDFAKLKIFLINNLRN